MQARHPAVVEKNGSPEAGRLRANRWFAAGWDLMVAREGKKQRAIREAVVSGASGRVLEIGCGTGANFAYYPPDATVVATDPDSKMLERAGRRLDKLGLKSIELRRVPAEGLPFEDASFDHVVCSWVLCHVDDVPRALGEVRRLLKRDGTFRFMEHVRSDGRVRGRMQDLVDPVWKRLLGAGCNVNRRTEQAIEDAGFRIETIERTGLLPPTSPAIYGVAKQG